MTGSSEGAFHAIEIHPAEDCNFFLLTPLGQPHNESLLYLGDKKIDR